ncbi:2-keto-3-deoxygluconate permease [Jiella avicenniae]|uniref:2-keto-3-deoxygluconate permease n=1 Tax=Jiella avicenniae TaxID=2907202 RepID=A0A9X1P2G8_9HYPH|nr:2-keto-3-deoxygluconate permease [Jiella avicenniae]MCE7030172.1 2-keto-3-deoxygluconate permease [Jiella avicenniae]
MKIKATLDRIPGGMMVVPLLLGATINTFLPGLLRIGNFTQALFVDSAGALIALFLLCAGAQISLTNVGSAAAKGATLLAVKWLVGAAVGLLAYVLAGTDGLFLGMVPLAIIAAMTNSNGGLYVAIVGQYGKADDKAAYSLLALNDGPFLTMVALTIFGAMGFVNGLFSIVSFVSVLLPIVVGIVLGNLDPDLRNWFARGSDMLIPFFAFALGMGIDFGAIIAGGLAGIAIGVMTTLFTGTVGYLVFRAIGWNPIVGSAEGSTAGNAVATPMAIAAANPVFQSVAQLATVQVAASTVTTAILLPLYVSFLVSRTDARRIETARDDEALDAAEAGTQAR